MGGGVPVVSFFWLLLSGCAVSAWLVGYGMGYLKGVRDTIPADIRDDDRGFSGDWSGRETGAPMPRRMWDCWCRAGTSATI